MNNTLKFLAIGAVALGFSQMSLAAENDVRPEVKQTIEHNIRQSIKTQFDKGFLTEKADISVNITTNKILNDAGPSPDLFNTTESLSTKFKALLTPNPLENATSRLNNKCNITLTFDENGNIPNLSSDKEILDLTKFTTPAQKEIAQKFVSLHEHFHCEFGHIDSPIMTPGKDAAFNKKINYLMKDQSSAPGVGQVAYVDILNENFADVGAAVSLLKEYGTNNADLNYVLKAITTQRHATDLHFSHFSLQDVLSDNTLSHLDQVKDTKSFDEFALSIANRGVVNLLAHRSDILDSATSIQNIVVSVFATSLKTIYTNNASPEETNKLALEHSSNSVSPGVVKELVKEFIAQSDLSGYKNKTNDITFSKASDDVFNMLYPFSKILSDPTHSVTKEFNDTLTEFKTLVPKITDTSDLDYSIKKPNKSEVLKNMKTMQMKFTQSISGTQLNTPKM
jgi:hypothetical protein